MNFLIIQENGRHDKNRQFRECFSLQRALIANGQECTVWGLNHANWEVEAKRDTLRHVIDFNSFDVIINLENYDEIGWVPNLSGVKAYKVIWCIDAHCRGMTPYLNTYSQGKYNVILQANQDYLYLACKGYRCDANSVWFPNCYDDTLIQPRDVIKRADVGFCGNILNRADKLNLLKQHFKLIADVFVIGDDMVNAINSYNIHFNMNIANDINYRSFETIGCKIPLVTNYNPQYEELGFKSGVNCAMYYNDSELIDQIEVLLNNDSMLCDIAKAGYELSKKHTYNARAKHLIKYLESII